ncbi:MAG: PD-(D/E)XK nuclease family protein, partial [Clostridia bacterium]|nr:PD-(D/E)XK nuclease family protein [Clostridia bacterium]
LTGSNLYLKIDQLQNDREYMEYHGLINTYLSPVLDLFDAVHSAHNISKFCDHTTQFLEKINFTENILALARLAYKRGDVYKHSILKQTIGKIDKIFVEMQDFVPDFATNFAEFVLIFRTSAQSTSISPLPISADCVYVSSTITGAFEPRHSSYFLCATEGNMPSFTLDVGLITDSDIAILASSGIHLTPSVNTINITNKFKLIQQLALSTHALTLTYPMYHGAEKFFPSTVTQDILNAFHWRGNPLSIVNIDTMLSNDLAFGSTLDRLLFRWGNSAKMLDNFGLSTRDPLAIPDHLRGSIHQYLINNGLSDILDNITTTRPMPNLDTHTAQALFFPKNRTKVTEIERYFQCPYMHYLEYGLKLRTRTISQIDSLTIGTILHAVLEHFTTQNMQNAISFENIPTIAGEIFDKIISDPEYAYLRVSGQNQTLLSGLRAESIRMCQAIFYQLSHSRYQIKFVEASFGESQFAPVPEIAIVDKSINLAVRGKIDRVDGMGNRYRIIDYKTSKHSGSFSLLDFYLGKKIQLFYYAASLLRGLRERDADSSIGGVFYLPLHREYSSQSSGSDYQSFKMDGVVVASPDNLLAQDDSVSFDNPRSDILPFAISTSKENVASNNLVIQKNKANVTREEMQMLLDYSEALVTQAITELVDGYILAKPINKACDFCPYRSICRIQCNDTSSIRDDEWSVEIKDFGGIKW